MKYQKEINFLKLTGELDITLKLDIDELNVLIEEYPNLPEDFVDFLKEIGGGYFNNAQFEIKNFLFRLSDLGLEDTYDVPDSFVFFGDNHSGDFVGFDLAKKNSKVIELDHVTGEIFETQQMFKDFLKEQIGLYE